MGESASKDKRLSWVSRDGKTLLVRQLRVDELDLVYALGRAEQMDGMAPIACARAVLNRNPDAIYGVYETGSDGAAEKFAGFLSFLLLTEEGAKRLKRGQFDVSNPDVRYLVPDGVRPALIYIWLIVARGLGGVGIPLTTSVMGPLYAGVSLCGTAATEAGARTMRSFGFQPIHKDRPDVGNLFWLERAAAPAEPVRNAPPSGRVSVVVAHSSLEVEHARAIRAAVYIAEQNCPFAEEFDGNDNTATHLVGYLDGEPAATLRIRYFGTFVKIERLAVLKRFRGYSLADEVVSAALEFCRRKGYRKAYGHPQLRLVPFWAKYGFTTIDAVGTFTFSDHEYVAVEGDLEAHPDAIGIDSDPYVIVRPEGEWDEAGILEQSALRVPTNPHVSGS